jgi:hypothetical protein
MAEGIELVDVALADVSSSCQGIRESHETETGMLVNESASSSDPDHRLCPHPFNPSEFAPQYAQHHRRRMATTCRQR